MREIKFRAWDKKKKMFPFIGFHVVGEVAAFDSLNDYFVSRLNDLIIEQYTGLKDKNGKDIYEGDIVKAHYFYFNENFDNDGEVVGDVKFTEWFSFAICNKECSLEFMDTSHFEEPCIEIIGNIHENPKLLEE